MHDYYFSIRSATGVGFHTVLGSPTLSVNEQVISFKMAKLQGSRLFCFLLPLSDFPHTYSPFPFREGGWGGR